MKPEVQHHMAHPRGKPLHAFKVRCLDTEPQPVLGHERLKHLNGGCRPRPDAFFLDVHVNVEHAAAWLEGQQARLPNRFARRKQAEMAPVGHPFESKKSGLVVAFVDGQAFQQVVGGCASPETSDGGGVDFSGMNVGRTGVNKHGEGVVAHAGISVHDHLVLHVDRADSTAFSDIAR